MIVLHQFAPSFGLVNVSPFCLKLESWLRLAGLPYRVEQVYDLAAAPKGKAPFIDDGDRRIGDSGLIIAHLRQTRGIDPDSRLTPAQRGYARAIEAMLEDRLYFAALHDRWMEPTHWPIVRDGLLAGLPDEIAEAVRGDQRARLIGHGIGMHEPAEIYAIADADLAALADALGGQPFLFGERPVGVDCTAFASVHGIIGPSFEGPLRQSALRHANLVAYEARMRARLFPEILDSAGTRS